MNRTVIAVFVLAAGCRGLPVHAQSTYVPRPLKPFSSATNYMSVPGYLRWRNYGASRNWACQGLVRLSEQYSDSQEGGADAVSGMNAKSVHPETVNYSLQVNGGPLQEVPYRAVEVHPKGIFGGAIRIDLVFGFCIGPAYRYSFNQFVSPEGLLDKVGNLFDPAAFQNGERTQKFRFHLEYSPVGRLVVVDDVSGKKTESRYEDGLFYLPALTPIDQKRQRD